MNLCIGVKQFRHHLSAGATWCSNIGGIRNQGQRKNIILGISLGIGGKHADPFSTHGISIGRIFNIETRMIFSILCQNDRPHAEMGIRRNRHGLCLDEKSLHFSDICIEVIRQSIQDLILQGKHFLRLFLGSVMLISKGMKKPMYKQERQFSFNGMMEIICLSGCDFRRDDDIAQINIVIRLYDIRLHECKSQNIRRSIGITVLAVEFMNFILAYQSQ